MALTDTEKDWIKEFVANSSHEAAKGIIRDVMSAHIQSCPHGKKLMKMIFLFAGITAGTSIAGGSAGFAIMKLLLGSP